jgi:penicillin V acylase-like amidase (Ntn superfamily)
MKRIPVTLLFCLFIQSALPCSTFFINYDGQMVFGRNYDWVAGTGIVCTNQRGLNKTSFAVPDGRSVAWTSRYGSITFNQYGKEFPTGGMNEKGLVVELMWLDETQYPKADDRPAIGVLQWIQYQLDNCGSIEDVIATDKLLRITATTTPLHYLVADATGNAAAIEFLNGSMVVHKGRGLSFPVLTNSVYAESAQYAKQAIQNNSPVEGSGSLERFARTCQMINQYQAGKSSASLIDQSFNILQAVAQGSHTKWSIVYDITNRRVYFRTHAAQQIKSVSFSAFDFSCNVASLCFNMNTEVKGDVSNSFRPLTMEFNKQTLKQTAELSKNEVKIPAAMQEAAVRYASLIGCK